MFREQDIKVTLVNKEEVKNFVRSHGEFACVCYATPTKNAEVVGRTVLDDGHFSGSRADYFKFNIELVPRYTSDQIVRHEQGTVKNVQSQRYVDMSAFRLFIDEFCHNDNYLKSQLQNVEKFIQNTYLNCKEYMSVVYPSLTEEQMNDHIRTILPIGAETKLNLAMDIEALIHFMHKRLCLRADKPIRVVAQLMLKEILEVAPIYEKYLVPQCEFLLYCPEKHGCGKCKYKKQDIKNILDGCNTGGKERGDF